MKRLFSILAFVATLVSPTWADFDAGVDAFRAGDYQTAMGEWRALAEGGNANAQHNVGILYNYGLGVLEDFATAAAWYRKAAEQGHANAQVKLGYLHATGRGVAQDASLAVAWFREAAEGGLAVAQYNIGMMYVTGTGIDTDKVHALMWLMLAADGGIEAATTKRDDLMASLTVPRDRGGRLAGRQPVTRRVVGSVACDRDDGRHGIAAGRRRSSRASRVVPFNRGGPSRLDIDPSGSRRSSRGRRV